MRNGQTRTREHFARSIVGYDRLTLRLPAESASGQLIPMKIRARIEFEGIVQGVGFRPFLHKLADSYGLAGWVLNTSAGVLMELEGTEQDIKQYVETVECDGPPLSRVLVARVRQLPLAGFTGFTIKPSRREEGELTLLCPDVATCDDCRRELFDPADRRFRYPFINCTNCGPRYSIVRGLPYDRPRTTMAEFELCAPCRAEYEDVADRRYHAQPVACSTCGPRLWFETGTGETLPVEAVGEAGQRLLAGEILVLKGLGGFHLACRADDDEAVLGLRRRKGRSFFKPLAVMVHDLAAARQLCEIEETAVGWLESPVSPVVLLPLLPAAVGQLVSPYVAPHLDRLGLMLPYTPLHHLLLSDVGVPLVMTSGNLSDEPIVGDNDTARQRLVPLADGLVLHDRPIHARCDDSVLSVDAPGSYTVFRHSRGFSPFPLALSEEGPPVLALGGDLKTTFAASRGHFAFLSPHLGDGESLATYAFFRATWEHYRELFHLEPRAIGCDLHPGYHTGRWAAELASELDVELHKVQHHHAHLAALQAEFSLKGQHVAIVADGTGYGSDGTLWGGEILAGDALECERLAHLRPIMLPGGDGAVREPWRIAMALIHQAAPEYEAIYMEQLLSGALAARARREFPARIADDADPLFHRPAARDVDLVQAMLASSTSLTPSSSLGRLFDGVAALLGVTLRTTYEGQAPMELESLARQPASSWTDDLRTDAADIIDWGPFVRDILTDSRSIRDWARDFHRWAAAAFAAPALRYVQERGQDLLLATGGCLQNAILKDLLQVHCIDAGVRLVTHQDVPAGDGGLALGVLRIVQSRLTGD